jgi:hypothetical protein
MEIDILIQQVMEFVAIGNWEQVHTFAAVCKFWRHSSLPHLSNIRKVPMDGGAEHRLNIGAFLHFLQSEHFRNVQCIFIPCRKTKRLFVNDIKQVCPSVQTIVHRKWLMINGSMEEIQEGEGHIFAADGTGMTCLLQRVQMHGFNLTGTKSATLFWNHCLLHLLSYDNGTGLEHHFKDTNDEWGSFLI